MKSKKRHEMETNELAASLMRLFEQTKTHQRPILYGAIGVLVIVGVLIVYPTMRTNKETSVQAAFATAEGSGEVDAMRDFIAKYPDAPQAALARLTAADRLVGEVVRGLKVAAGEDAKAKAARQLSEAKELYTEAAKSPEVESLVKVGLALIDVQEGAVDKGQAELQEVATKYPDSLASARAKVHLEALAGYKPVQFSNEPLEEKKEPAAKPGEPKEGETKAGPAKAPELTGPEPKAKEKKPDAPPPAKPKG